MAVSWILLEVWQASVGALVSPQSLSFQVLSFPHGSLFRHSGPRARTTQSHAKWPQPCNMIMHPAVYRARANVDWAPPLNSLGWTGSLHSRCKHPLATPSTSHQNSHLFWPPHLFRTTPCNHVRGPHKATGSHSPMSDTTIKDPWQQSESGTLTPALPCSVAVV